MARLRVHNVAISLDGYGAGPNQGLETPLGEGGTGLHEWVFDTPTGRRMMGIDGGSDGAGDDGVALGIDDEFLTAGDVGIGATVMGRNMFGPVRGPWGDEDWRGWWGPEPPYHHEVFVLTHHAQAPIEMVGGTTFNFVTDGIESALDQAFAAADGLDVRLGGGVSTIQQYLRAGLVDEMHLALVPLLLGRGERLFADDDFSARYECVDFVSSGSVGHVRIARID